MDTTISIRDTRRVGTAHRRNSVMLPRGGQRPPYKATQSGAILVTSLIILAVLTILGISGISSGILEQRMAGNTRQAQIAFEASEAALRAGELWLANNVNIQAATQLETRFDGSQVGFYSERRPSPGVSAAPSTDSLDVANHSDWLNPVPNSIQVALADYNPGVTLAQRPRFIIEYLGRTTVSAGNQSLANLDIILDPSKVAEDVREHAFRVTAIGWGMDATATRIVQSTVRRPLD